MIRVITVEREYGSGGGVIAKRLAEHLGWQLWDHAITCEIAKRLHCDISAVEQREERCDTTFYRLMKSFMRGSYEDQLGSSAVDLLDAEHLAELFNNISLDIAKKGNAVIVGRGSTWFLRNRPDVFHIFIYAPREHKIENLRRSGQSQSEAEELVERVDRERAAFIKKYYDMNWPTRELYHMMLNSSVGNDIVLRLVLQEIELLNAATPAAARAAG